jgi:hypothetical protein
MLLAPHGDSIDVVQAAGLADGFLEGSPPVIWMDLGALRV